jgi:hypothetical protein
MIMQTANRSCRRGRDSLFGMAIGAMALSMASCAEIEVGAEAYKSIAQANEQPAPPVLRSTARQDSIEPSLEPDPKAFYATDLALWDGARTLPGIWIAHPLAEVARRVRLTNGETGTRVDAAMFRRDPNLSGPRVIVSSEAAERLGLTPGHDTPITIEGLAYRADTEAAAVVASAVEAPVPVPAEVLATDVPAEEIAAEPSEPDLTPAAALSPAAPVTPEPTAAAAMPPDAAADKETGPEPALSTTGVINAGGTGGIESTWEKAQPVAGAPAPQPVVGPAGPVPAPVTSGDITDGRHFIQAGIFGQPENAARLVERLRAADLPANELPLTLGERQLTRVLVGPYRTIAERNTALETVRKLGPADATPARG